MLRSKVLLTFLILLALLPGGADAERPNILWIVVDDMSANFSCYGETAIKTPEVDRLARDGLRFTRAYATSPVCSTFRSAMITGMYQNSIGAHHHRSCRGENRNELPGEVRPIPALFKDAGYWTCIGIGVPGRGRSSQKVGRDDRGKTDYNFVWDSNIYDSHDWAGRGEGQPFFMQVQLGGGKIRGSVERHYTNLEKRMAAEFDGPTPLEKVVLPPHYPADPVLVRDWARYLDSVRITDWHVGEVIRRLKAEDLLENTLVVFFTDHGISHARGKQFLYDEGTHIPLVLCGPGIDPGKERTDLVEHIDIAALSLAAAGISVPDWMEGRDLLHSEYKPREFVYAARDRCGEAADRIRSVRSDEWLYIRNFYPERPHLMPSNYKDSKAILQALRRLHAEERLSALSKRLLFAPTRPEEELYRFGEDRWQLVNLADRPEHADTLTRHRAALDTWTAETGDPGPESVDIYKLEIREQMKATGNKASRERYGANSEVYLQWFREGK